MIQQFPETDPCAKCGHPRPDHKFWKTRGREICGFEFNFNAGAEKACACAGFTSIELCTYCGHDKTKHRGEDGPCMCYVNQGERWDGITDTQFCYCAEFNHVPSERANLRWKTDAVDKFFHPEIGIDTADSKQVK